MSPINRFFSNKLLLQMENEDLSDLTNQIRSKFRATCDKIDAAKATVSRDSSMLTNLVNEEENARTQLKHVAELNEALEEESKRCKLEEQAIDERIKKLREMIPKVKKEIFEKQLEQEACKLSLAYYEKNLGVKAQVDKVTDESYQVLLHLNVKDVTYPIGFTVDRATKKISDLKADEELKKKYLHDNDLPRFLASIRKYES